MSSPITHSMRGFSLCRGRDTYMFINASDELEAWDIAKKTGFSNKSKSFMIKETGELL